MIDIENKVFNECALALRADFPGISVYGENVQAPASFPSVSIVEITNTTSTKDLSGTTTHADIAFQVDVYSNLTSGKKAQAKKITEEIDEIMERQFRMTRSFCEPVQNLYDSTVYRITARYRRMYGTGDDI